jgi:hypothetical protein
MRIAGWFDSGEGAFALFAGMMLVVTSAVVLAGLIGLALKRRASARHAVWLCALAVVLLSPALAWVGRTVALPPIAWPESASTVETVEKRPEPSPAPTLIFTARVPGFTPPMEETHEYGSGVVVRLLPEQTDAPAVVAISTPGLGPPASRSSRPGCWERWACSCVSSGDSEGSFDSGGRPGHSGLARSCRAWPPPFE